MKSLIVTRVANGWIVTKSETILAAPFDELRVFTSCDSPYGEDDLLWFLRDFYREKPEEVQEKLDAESLRLRNTLLPEVPCETEP